MVRRSHGRRHARSCSSPSAFRFQTSNGLSSSNWTESPPRLSSATSIALRSHLCVPGIGPGKMSRRTQSVKADGVMPR